METETITTCNVCRSFGEENREELVIDYVSLAYDTSDHIIRFFGGERHLNLQ